MTDDPRLDETQQAVVDLADDADAIVLGAAGSGKTLVAIELVADRLLRRGWEPGSVVVLGASRRSAALLRDRLAARIAIPMPGSPARTAASLAHAIVTRAAAESGEPPPRYLSGADHDRILARVLEADGIDWPATIGPAARALPAFRAELRELIARVVERGHGAAELAARGRELGRPAWVAAAACMSRLAEAIAAERPEDRPLDSVHVLRRATELVRAADPAVPVPRLLVVDDAQELGVATGGLVAALLTRGARLVALGDPDIATGGFRGARPREFVSPEFWSGRRPERLVLGAVHRQGPELRATVQAAVAAVGATAGAFAQRKAAAAGAPGALEVATVPDAGRLAALIARRLRERAVRGTAWQDLAVVVRSGGAIPRLARELRLLEVPAVGAGVAEQRRDDWAVEGLLAVARAAIDGARGELRLSADAAEAMLTGAVGRLDAVSFRRLRAGLRRAALEADPTEPRRSGDLVAAALGVPGGFAWLDRPEGRAAARAAGVLHEAIAAVVDGASIEELLWTIWSGSGLERIWGEQSRGGGLLADEADRHLDAVLALFAAAKRYVEQTPTGSAARFLQHWLGAEVEEDSLAGQSTRGTVTVGTPQALLGREFELVVIAELQEGTWPNPRLRGTLLGAGDYADLADGLDPGSLDRRREVLHDEVRLLAAALGRARDGILAVAIDGEEETPSPLLGLLGEPRPAEDGALTPLTLRGLVGAARAAVARNGDPAAARALARLARSDAPGADPATWQGLLPISSDAPLTEPEQPVPVHPSSLGRWLECPLHWALARLGADAGSAASSLGSIVHDAAHALAESTIEPSAEAVLAAVLQRWGELDFESDWLEQRERLRAGLVADRLAAYERELRQAGGVTLASETRLDVEIGRAHLQGRIDRVERVPGPDGDTAIVVDFKTGKETRNASARQLAENPQLAAYQLGLLGGGIEGVELDGARPGEARLIVLGLGPDKPGYATRAQPVLDEAAAREWRARIAEAAEGMSGGAFLAYVDSHCTSRDGGLCPIHVVGSVTA